MTKDEALKKIKELEQYVQGCDKKNKLTADCESVKVRINGSWAYSQYAEENQGLDCTGNKNAGHGAMLFLRPQGHGGTWYDQSGNVLGGHLFYEPAKDESC